MTRLAHSYDCPHHGSTLWLKPGEAPPSWIQCSWCGRLARRVAEEEKSRLDVLPMPKFRPGYILAFDREVGSRRTLRELQKQHGVTDYEPSSRRRQRQYKSTDLSYTPEIRTS